jgi:hypothetical protein
MPTKSGARQRPHSLVCSHGYSGFPGAKAHEVIRDLPKSQWDQAAHSVEFTPWTAIICHPWRFPATNAPRTAYRRALIVHRETLSRPMSLYLLLRQATRHEGNTGDCLKRAQQVQTFGEMNQRRRRPGKWATFGEQRS